MAAQNARARKAPAPKQTPLPPVTVARFEEALALVEELVDEQTDVFVAKGQQYRERHRTGTDRPLTAVEAAQIASVMAQDGLPPVTLAVAVQESELRAYDEPEAKEVLLAAGAATAPAFMGAVKRFIALIEMPAREFQSTREQSEPPNADELSDEEVEAYLAALPSLSEAIDARVREMDNVDLGDARDRANRALEHFAAAAGAASGKALGLMTRALFQALEQAATSLGLTVPQSVSLIGSAPSTDGLEQSSSTTSATATPSS